MNVSTFLSSTAAAVTLVGAIGFAYAQSSPDTATAPINPAAPPTQTVTPTDSMPMHPAQQNQQSQRESSGRTNAATTSDMPGAASGPAPDTSVVITERAAQSDRN